MFTTHHMSRVTAPLGRTIIWSILVCSVPCCSSNGKPLEVWHKVVWSFPWHRWGKQLGTMFSPHLLGGRAPICTDGANGWRCSSLRLPKYRIQYAYLWLGSTTWVFINLNYICSIIQCPEDANLGNLANTYIVKGKKGKQKLKMLTWIF